METWVLQPYETELVVVGLVFLAALCGMQNFPDQGLNLWPLQWKRGILTGPPGSSWGVVFFLTLKCNWLTILYQCSTLCVEHSDVIFLYKMITMINLITMSLYQVIKILMICMLNIMSLWPIHLITESLCLFIFLTYFMLPLPRLGLPWWLRG